MEKRNKPTIALRRHSTVSPSSAGRAVIASVRRQNSLNYRSMMKSNPYVGWFRHSPSTSPRVKISASTSSSTPSWCSVPSSLADCKNSPHIGWFRHAPPSRMDLPGINSRSSAPNILSPDEQDLLWKLLQELNPSLEQRAILVSGSLRGGGKEYLEKTRHRRSSSRALTVKNLQESSAIEGTMSTVNALSSLASWFLFPVAHDAESCGYRQDDGYPKKKNKKGKNKEENGLLSQLLSPYLPSFLEEPPVAIAQQEYSRYGARVDDHDTDCEAGGDDDSCSSSDSNSSSPSVGCPFPKLGSSTNDLSLSVSSLAEAYYAHQTTTKELSSEQERVVHPSTTISPATTVVSPHRLDYVITQMDIARMTRNASRHLDVHCILGLPVTTYQRGASRRIGASKQHAKASLGASSWTIVEESEGSSAEEEEQGAAPQQEVDFCVICLEHFVNGDRLRVLPCDHSFHVGCIDRWLSGSQSFEECYTSGCPTCKKRPTMGTKPRAQSFSEPKSNVREGKHRSGSLDGSVPSWAFAQIGSALVQAQAHESSFCSGA